MLRVYDSNGKLITSTSLVDGDDPSKASTIRDYAGDKAISVYDQRRNQTDKELLEALKDINMKGEELSWDVSELKWGDSD